MADLLVVDDDEDVSALVGEMLALEGHAVRVARSASEGLACLVERLPDAVLLDVEMPEVDGPAMVSEMARRDAGMERIPVVLMSGASRLHSLADRVGTPYVARKPCEFEALLRIVQRAIAERRPPSR